MPIPTTTLQNLIDLLHAIIPQIRFDTGEIHTVGDGTTTTYTAKPAELLSSIQLCRTLEDSPWDSVERKQATSARTICPSHLRAELSEKLRGLLSDYIDPQTNLIAHTAPTFESTTRHMTARPDGLREYKRESSIDHFTLGLLKSAALLGAERTAMILHKWLNYEPFSYSACSLIYGITAGRDLDLHNGIRVAPLPVSSDAFPISFPHPTSIRVQRCLGRSVLHITTEVQPALFLLENKDSNATSLQLSWPLGDASQDTLYEALSLICNRYIRAMMIWEEYDDINSLTGKSNGGGTGFSPMKNESRTVLGWSRDFATGALKLTRGGEPKPDLSLGDLQDAWEIFSLLDNRKKSDRRFEVAVDRWIRSQHPDLQQTDHFIDLRVALEALYLDGDLGEQTFRLALRGAWHLGKNWSERKQIQTALKKFYSVASKVIHGEAVNEAKGDHKWLEQARDICRRGILKTIKQKEQPDWDELILGREIE